MKRLHKDQALELVSVDATWFVGRLIESVHELLPLMSDSLTSRLGVEGALRSKVEQWAMIQGIAGSATDRDFVESITRQIITDCWARFSFTRASPCRQQVATARVDGLDSGLVLPTLNRAFAEALKIDYHAVFAEALPDTIKWPAEAARKACGASS